VESINQIITNRTLLFLSHLEIIQVFNDGDKILETHRSKIPNEKNSVEIKYWWKGNESITRFLVCSRVYPISLPDDSSWDKRSLERRIHYKTNKSNISTKISIAFEEHQIRNDDGIKFNLSSGKGTFHFFMYSFLTYRELNIDLPFYLHADLLTTNNRFTILKSEECSWNDWVLRTVCHFFTKNCIKLLEAKHQFTWLNLVISGIGSNTGIFQKTLDNIKGYLEKKPLMLDKNGNSISLNEALYIENNQSIEGVTSWIDPNDLAVVYGLSNRPKLLDNRYDLSGKAVNSVLFSIKSKSVDHGYFGFESFGRYLKTNDLIHHIGEKAFLSNDDIVKKAYQKKLENYINWIKTAVKSYAEGSRRKLRVIFTIPVLINNDIELQNLSSILVVDPDLQDPVKSNINDQIKENYPDLLNNYDKESLSVLIGERNIITKLDKDPFISDVSSNWNEYDNNKKLEKIIQLFSYDLLLELPKLTNIMILVTNNQGEEKEIPFSKIKAFKVYLPYNFPYSEIETKVAEEFIRKFLSEDEYFLSTKYLETGKSMDFLYKNQELFSKFDIGKLGERIAEAWLTRVKKYIVSDNSGGRKSIDIDYILETGEKRSAEVKTSKSNHDIELTENQTLNFIDEFKKIQEGQPHTLSLILIQDLFKSPKICCLTSDEVDLYKEEIVKMKLSGKEISKNKIFEDLLSVKL
jgi:hypothetical protein